MEATYSLRSVFPEVFYVYSCTRSCTRTLALESTKVRKYFRKYSTVSYFRASVRKYNIFVRCTRTVVLPEVRKHLRNSLARVYSSTLYCT